MTLSVLTAGAPVRPAPRVRYGKVTRDRPERREDQAMTTIDVLVRELNRKLSPQFEEMLRAELAGRDREWLIDQIVRLTLDAHRLQEIDRQSEREAKARARAERIERLRALALDRAALARFLAEHEGTTRESLLASGLLLDSAPAKGTAAITAGHRSPEGEALLERAKDVLFGLLFGDESTATTFDRTRQELLTFALPRHKAGALDFMRASTELTAAGTWQDPDSVSNDERADNVLLEVQYGETDDEVIGDGIVRTLSLVNNLEVNEQILYARMIDVEQTTLIS
jgi:hypothetical protein